MLARTSTTVAAVCLRICLLPTLARAADAPPALKDGNWDALKLTFERPEAVDTFGGNPIGNGHIGAKIKGGVGRGLGSF